MPHALVVAWEYPGVHSRRGAALARRVGQIVRGFADAEWAVTVAHRLNTEQDPARDAPVSEFTPDANIYTRHAIPGPSPDPRPGWWRLPARKAITAWTSFRHGDRSTSWARGALLHLRSTPIPAPDVIVGCFTPRGPLALAADASRIWNTPWIADFQDPWWEGTSTAVRPLVALWTRRVLRSASVVVQVSPEWAAEMVPIIRRDVAVLRHAVRTSGRREPALARKDLSNGFTVLYAGSLNEEKQDVVPFLEAIGRVRRHEMRQVVVEIAGSEYVWEKFNRAASALGVSDTLRWLGWIDSRALAQRAAAADCLLVVPLFSPDRRGVPSKLFEYLEYGRPVLIAGRDSGAFDTLLAEWGHPPVVASSVDEIAGALSRAMQGDDGGLLTLEACRRAPVTERDLARTYIAWAEQFRLNRPLDTGPARIADSA
jgi:glycosyltransferase involved in cell wall biosynthesis